VKWLDEFFTPTNTALAANLPFCVIRAALQLKITATNPKK